MKTPVLDMAITFNYPNLQRVFLTRSAYQRTLRLRLESSKLGDDFYSLLASDKFIPRMNLLYDF